MIRKSPRKKYSQSAIERPTKKKSNFIIDKISEDSFYENLLLGFPKLLKESPFVTKTYLERFPPATIIELQYWEFTNGLQLPEDLRNFYLSTNGFSFTYRFQYDKPSEDEEISHVIGGVEINPLQNLVRLNNAEITCLTELGRQYLAPHSKVFTVQKIDEKNSVVLAQFNPVTVPNFWLYSKDLNFFFLCNDFVTYFRMALAHIGVPGWQFNVLKMNLPEWSAEILQLMAPDVLNQDTCSRSDFGVINDLDVDIFKEIETDDHESDVKVNVKDKKDKSKNKKTPKPTARSAKNKKS